MKNYKILLPILLILPAALAIADSTAASPQSYWKFDERAGDIAYDSSGNGNSLMAPNRVNWDAGLVNAAVSLNGLNSFFKSTTTALDLPGSFSLAVWVNPDILPVQNTTISSSTPIMNSPKYFSLFTKGAAGKRGFEINFKNNYLNLTRLDQNDDLTGAVAFQNGQWQQAAVVWDSDKKTLSFYKDGVLWDSLNTVLNPPRKEDRVVVGANLSGDDHFYSGFIDEMRIYNRALSASEIKGLYSTDSARRPGRASFIAALFSQLRNFIINFLRVFK